MMTQAFYTGISGIRNTATGIDVVSNNLANVNTTGYRGSRTEFASLFEQSMSTGAGVSNSVGVGVRVNSTTMIRDQGSLALSDRSTDIAIMGDGWFGVQGDNATMYTRDGTFNFDENDDLVTSDGLHVLGTMGNNINEDGVLIKKIDEVQLGDIASQEKLRFPQTLTYPSEASTNVKFLVNLGTGEEGYEVITAGASVIDPQNNRNNLRLEFTKDAQQVSPGSQWNVVATTQTLDGTTIYDSKIGRVEFNAQGALISSTLTDIDNNGSIVDIDLGSGYDGVVAIDIPVISGSSVADGTIGGDLEGYSINENAEVIATFSNGMQSSVGKIAIYHFGNEQGLERLSGSKFQESVNSGRASFYIDENGQNINATQVKNFRLETSNVQMSVGLTDLIVLQRSFDANSKSITTADEMMQKALNMDA